MVLGGQPLEERIVAPTHFEATSACISAFLVFRDPMIYSEQVELEEG